MASINLTKERITRLVEMAQNEETFSLKFNGVSIAVMCAETYKTRIPSKLNWLMNFTFTMKVKCWILKSIVVMTH